MNENRMTYFQKDDILYLLISEGKETGSIELSRLRHPSYPGKSSEHFCLKLFEDTLPALSSEKSNAQMSFLTYLST